MTAGLPDLSTTLEVLTSLAELRVTAVELGFPYSDPIADGKTIQASFTRALEHKIKVADILDMVRTFRKQHDLPLLGMLSYSIVHRVGVSKFVQQSRDAGLDGLILPDLSLEEAESTAKVIGDAGLVMPMLVSPISHADRRARIAKISTGFIYYMSVTGITGERNELPPELVENVRELREQSGQPVVVGFGISTADHVRRVCQAADGAIIGSALVRRMMEEQDKNGNTRSIVKVVREAVSEWITGTQ